VGKGEEREGGARSGRRKGGRGGRRKGKDPSNV